MSECVLNETRAFNDGAIVGDNINMISNNLNGTWVNLTKNAMNICQSIGMYTYKWDYSFTPRTGKVIFLMFTVYSC